MCKTKVRVGVIGHIDTGKHTLVSALISALTQAGVEVVSLDQSEPLVDHIHPPTPDVPPGWSYLDVCDLGQYQRSGPIHPMPIDYSKIGSKSTSKKTRFKHRY